MPTPLKKAFTRQDGKCFFCHEELNKKHYHPFYYLDGWTFDHLLPRSKGGPDNWGNKVLSCAPCNTDKADRLPTYAEIRLFERQRGKPARCIRDKVRKLNRQQSSIKP